MRLPSTRRVPAIPDRLGPRPEGPDPIPTLLQRMRAAGWGPGAGAPETEVLAAEAGLGLAFPPDYRRFLREAGGLPPPRPWRGLFSLPELLSLNRALPVFRWYPGLLGIGNEGFLVLALDYRGGEPPSVATVGLSSSDPSDVIREAATFSEWLEGTLHAG